MATMTHLSWPAAASLITPIALTAEAAAGTMVPPFDESAFVSTSGTSNAFDGDLNLSMEHVVISSDATVDLSVNDSWRIDESSISYASRGSMIFTPSLVETTRGFPILDSAVQAVFRVAEASSFVLDFAFDGYCCTFGGAGVSIYAIDGGFRHVLGPDGTRIGNADSVGTYYERGPISGTFTGSLLAGEYEFQVGRSLGSTSSPRPSAFNSVSMRLTLAAVPEPSAALVFGLALAGCARLGSRHAARLERQDAVGRRD